MVIIALHLPYDKLPVFLGENFVLFLFSFFIVTIGKCRFLSFSDNQNEAEVLFGSMQPTGHA